MDSTPNAVDNMENVEETADVDENAIVEETSIDTANESNDTADPVEEAGEKDNEAKESIEETDKENNEAEKEQSPKTAESKEQSDKEDVPAQEKENILTKVIPTHFTPSLAVLTVINTATAIILLVYQIFFPDILPFPERLWGAIVLLICSGAILGIAIRRSKELAIQAAAENPETEKGENEEEENTETK